jgi:esterase/lipase superfamily enzyme
MEQLALKYSEQGTEDVSDRLKLRNVILTGSDLDRGVFDSYLADGLLSVTGHLTIYMSRYDKALGMSQFLTNRQRLRQMFGDIEGEMTKNGRIALDTMRDRISFVNVSGAEGADSGNGHGYFRSSPWVSRDVLMTLAYGIRPRERGLVEQDQLPVYEFPPDYIDRLWDAIGDVDPEFAAKFEVLRANSQ